MNTYVCDSHIHDGLFFFFFAPSHKFLVIGIRILDSPNFISAFIKNINTKKNITEISLLLFEEVEIF